MSNLVAFEVGQLLLPLKTIASTLTAAQQDLFVRLPGLQGYWPMGTRFSSGAVVEHGGTGTSLVQTGICPTGFDGESYAQLGLGTNFLLASGVFGITGLETFISSLLRGLTIGGWFKIDVSPTITSGLTSKDGAAPQRGYNLSLTSANLVQFVVSGNGTGLDTVQSAAVAIGEWIFIAGRFTPSTEIAVFTNGTKTVVTTSIPASLNASTQNFEVGRTQNGNSRIIDGKVRDLFICAASLSDETIDRIRASSTPT